MVPDGYAQAYLLLMSQVISCPLQTDDSCEDLGPACLWRVRSRSSCPQSIIKLLVDEPGKLLCHVIRPIKRFAAV